MERLSAAGMVKKIPNPKNRREVLLRPTPSGWQVVRQVNENRRTQMAAIVEALDPQSRQDLITALPKFSEAGGEPPAVVPDLPAGTDSAAARHRCLSYLLGAVNVKIY